MRARTFLMIRTYLKQMISYAAFKLITVIHFWSIELEIHFLRVIIAKEGCTFTLRDIFISLVKESSIN